ncbi:MAG: signal peptidase II [Myxococcota bacterium]|nr:signal peptidase II [Myxococcota bacterium]
MNQSTKLICLGLLFATWLIADLWTKDWADSRLADPRHPIAVKLSASDVGKRVGDVVSERLELGDGPDAKQTRRHVVRLPPHKALDPSAPIFGVDSPVEGVGSFYVFWRDDDALAPRRIDRSERLLVTRWLSWTLPEADPASLRSAANDKLSSVTVSQWLQANLRRIDEERANKIAREGLFPITSAPAPVSETTVISENCASPSPRCLGPGDQLLVQWRRIDVMGEWFKYVYAENTGAAFGLLKGANPIVRDTLFFSLTVVVFLVILGILIRTEPRHWMVLVALTGVLAGAMGNFIDRVRYGYVIDFIDMDLGFMHWPTYNVADIGISCGVVLLMLDITFNPESPLVTEPVDPESTEDVAEEAPEPKDESPAAS